MILKKWFTMKNNHYQVLPNLGWTTEVYQWLKDYTFAKGGWVYNFGMSFAWLNLSTGFRLSGTFFDRK